MNRLFVYFPLWAAAFLLRYSAMAQSPATVLDYTNEWRYLHVPSLLGQPGVTWNTNGYDDSGWWQGRGVFSSGAENVAEAPENSRIPIILLSDVNTTYFRTSLTLTSSPGTLVINGSALIDDGAVIYVNGREAQRIAMPAGPVNYRTYATRQTEVSARGAEKVALDPNNFVHGTNLIAVELHQPVVFNEYDAVFGLRIDVDARPPVVITAQPANQRLMEGERTAFSVVATGANLQYQWFSNNIAIPGARSSTYQTPRTTLNMDGLIYHVVIRDFIESVSSTSARLTVVPDTFGPRVERISLFGDSRRPIVDFDEFVLGSSVTNPANYSILVLGTTNTLAITNVDYAQDQMRLWCEQDLDPAGDYILCIANVADLKGNIISPNPTYVPVPIPTTNRVVNMGDVWRCNQMATNGLPTNWMALEYDVDPGLPPYHWFEAPAAFARSLRSGFLPCSPVQTALTNRQITYYFRKRFVVASDYPTNTFLILRHLVDDAAVVYLNGAEIFRRNLLQGPVDHSTRPHERIGDALCMVQNILGRPRLGENLLAVEVHQHPDDFDVLFDISLDVVFQRTPLLPQLRATHDAHGQTILTWDIPNWTLENTESSSDSWSPVSTLNNRYVVPPGAQTPRFFRLAAP